MADYFDIHQILMEEEAVSVVFRVGANGVGLLDPGSENNNVEAGAKVELPFWLAQDLDSMPQTSSRYQYPNLFQPKAQKRILCYAEGHYAFFETSWIKKEIKADPARVNLRSRCPYFYELGCKLAPLVSDRGVGSFLLDTFRGRYQDILCKAHREAFSLTSKSQNLLTTEESQLFEAAHDSMKAFKKWRLQGPRLEKASVLGRKRKLNESLHAT